jgi:hypothetical protein
MNQFQSEIEGAVSSVAKLMNTSACKGTPITVYNPIEADRHGAVTVRLDNIKGEYVKVFDGETETQTGTWAQDGDKVTISYSEDGDDIAVEFTFKDGKLTMTDTDMGMEITIVYSKSK